MAAPPEGCRGRRLCRKGVNQGGWIGPERPLPPRRPRKLTITKGLRTTHEDQVTDHLGPDLQAQDLDPAAAVARLARDPGRAIASPSTGTWRFTAAMLYQFRASTVLDSG